MNNCTTISLQASKITQMKTNLKLSISIIIIVLTLISQSNISYGQCNPTLSPSPLYVTSSSGSWDVAVTGCSSYNVTNFISSWASYTKYSYKITITVQANTGSARNGRMLIGNT